MATLMVSDDQVIEMALQLSEEKRRALLQELLRRPWPAWDKHAAYSEERARETAARRGRNWDKMTEEERDDFVDELVHEDRPCPK